MSNPNQYLEQAKQNKALLAILDDKVPDRYFDWKTTITFYTALHIIKAYAELKGSSEHEHRRHDIIINNMKPQNANAAYPVSQDCYDNYLNLKHLASTARYHGISDLNHFIMLQKFNYELAKQNLEEVEKFAKSQGLEVA